MKKGDFPHELLATLVDDEMMFGERFRKNGKFQREENIYRIRSGVEGWKKGKNLREWKTFPFESVSFNKLKLNEEKTVARDVP